MSTKRRCHRCQYGGTGAPAPVDLRLTESQRWKILSHDKKLLGTLDKVGDRVVFPNPSSNKINIILPCDLIEEGEIRMPIQGATTLKNLIMMIDSTYAEVGVTVRNMTEVIGGDLIDHLEPVADRTYQLKVTSSKM